MNLLFCPGHAVDERAMAQKNYVARKQGAMSHMTRTCKTVEPCVFPSCPCWTYSWGLLEICIHRIV